MSSSRASWLFYAIASGGCAAMNGAFAKLTTTELTSQWAATISRHLRLSENAGRSAEILIRALFFLLNLAFNAVMWGFFTRALTLATSTVRVSVINTSANFMITALLGLVIFRESLPGLWWLGASFLVAGSVIIGRRDEGKEANAAKMGVSEATATESESYQDEPDAPLPDAAGVSTDEAEMKDSIELKRKSKTKVDEDDEDVKAGKVADSGSDKGEE